MAEEFSYSNDIAPIKGDFFNTRPLSNRESDFIRKRFGAQNDKLAEDVIQLQTARTRMRSADLAYEAGLLDLEEKKDLRDKLNLFKNKIKKKYKIISIFKKNDIQTIKKDN